MNPDTLRPVLRAYRAQLEAAWSPETAHRGEGTPGSPANQCGVTAAWLAGRLRVDHDIIATYCMGPVHDATGPLAEDHCWLEIGPEPDPLIVDLTADQWNGHPAVICSHYSDLAIDDQLYYARISWLGPAGLAADPVQTRLVVLTEAIAS